MSVGSKYYREFPVSNWADLRRLYRAMAPGKFRWAFRGLSNEAWGLETSLERALGPDLSNALKVEVRLVREFVRRSHHYSSYIPRKDDVVEWFALMQHHGAPTRLLDWTYSFFVGLHFATESVKPGESCALWSIDIHWFLEQYFKPFDTDVLKRWEDGKDTKLIQAVLEKKSPGVLPVNSLRLNERQVTQQGLFFLPGDVIKSFEDNIRAMTLLRDLRTHVNKLVIRTTPKFLRQINSELTAMNISEASLFPGLDGFARSLRAFARRDWSKGIVDREKSIFSEIHNLES